MIAFEKAEHPTLGHLGTFLLRKDAFTVAYGRILRYKQNTV